MARISEELGIHVVTLYNWRKAWRLQGKVVSASEKEPEVCSAAGKFTVVMETAGLNATELSAYCRDRGLFAAQGSRWRQAAPTWPLASVPEALDANAQPVLTMAEQKEIARLRAQDQREIKALNKEMQRKEKAMAEMAPCWCCEKSGRPSVRRTRKADQHHPLA